MPKIRITDAVVARASLDENKSEAVVWDSDITGFGLRLRRGSKSWIVAYRPVGAGRSATTRRVRLGSPGTIKTASEARALARVVLGKVAAGQDPAAERAAQKRRSSARVSDLLNAYDRDLERRGYVNRKMVINGLRARLNGLMERDAATVTGAELAAIMEKLESAGLRGAAEDFRLKARAFFTYCQVKAKVLTTNPLAGHRKERTTRADRLTKAEHGRALSDDELVRVWRSADPDTSFGRLVRFLVLSGCRRAEGAGVTRGMVDRPAGVVRFPAAFVKQGRGHDVPIAPMLAEVLDGCPTHAGVELVFPSPKSGGPFKGWSQLLAGLRERSGVEFSLHDLRRTFRTGLSRLGVEDAVAELALGHARKDLEARYNRDEAAAAIRVAFEKWDAHVAKIGARRE